MTLNELLDIALHVVVVDRIGFPIGRGGHSPDRACLDLEALLAGVLAESLLHELGATVGPLELGLALGPRLAPTPCVGREFVDLP
jgi:hypothetical protein